MPSQTRGIIYPPTTQHLGIIYATGSKILRRLVIPDVEPDANGWLGYVGAGETYTLLPLAGDTSYAAVIQQIRVATATAVIPTGRCCVVDGTGSVVDCINADPVLDSIAGRTLVASDTAAVGDHYNVEILNDFSRRYAVVLTATGIVAVISWLVVVGATPPDGLHFIVPSLTLQVGDLLPAHP